MAGHRHHKTGLEDIVGGCVGGDSRTDRLRPRMVNVIEAAVLRMPDKGEPTLSGLQLILLKTLLYQTLR